MFKFEIHKLCFVIEFAFLSLVLLCWTDTGVTAQFEDKFDPFEDSYYEASPPYLVDVVKNVPRMGRRNDLGPRIGRRSDFNVENGDGIFKRNDFFLKAAKSVPRIGRRDDSPGLGKRSEDGLTTAVSV